MAMASILLLLIGIFAANFNPTAAQVGVCYGMMGNNLPNAREVIDLYRSNNIRRMRLYDPNSQALQALRGSNIEVILGVPNSELPNLANPSGAQSWVQRNVVPYWPSVRIRYIAVGTSRFGEPNQGLDRDRYDLDRVSFPPSAGAFRGDIRTWIPNLFDAMLDSLYSALEKAGQGGLEVVVSESGWPSAGGFGTSVDNAATYLSNLIRHVGGGTPKRPGKAIETYLFALFDENQKPGPEIEKHFGLFSPNKQPKYPLRLVEEEWGIMLHSLSRLICKTANPGNFPSS
ncbi:DNA-directed RNA polymerase II subunit RPB9-like [Hibiscus syriacus]|uniref:glucan endo-1,3-beta-D-glucosidase n=1 Tax=Hibiscus syriacus TaxID=106335 RepID=A0A6A3CQW4_HIBSY|nr:DNA-directed RNA polymerase II subunit RPB9-like [Hibiscus syriacus]